MFSSFSKNEDGLFMMAAPIALAVVAPFSGYLSDKIGSEILMHIGLVITTLGLVLIVTLDEKSSIILLLYNRMSAKAGHRVTNYIAGRDDSFIYGMQGVYIASAGLCSVGIFITALRLYRPKKNMNNEITGIS